MSYTLDFAQTYHVVTPVEDNDLAQAIARIMQKEKSATRRVAAIHALLRQLGISKQAILFAYGASSKSATVPNNSPGKHGLKRSSEAMKAARARELYYRSLYIVSSSRRVQERLNEGKTVRTVLADESLNYRRHEAARRNRLDAAGQSAQAESQFGLVLGWYHNPALNNEIECLTASGHNFLASEGTIIGFPGAVHPNCGCKAGPPHEGGMGNSCNEALATIVRKGKQARYTVRNSPRRRTA